MSRLLETWIAEHSAVVKNTFDNVTFQLLNEVASQIALALKANGKLMLFGNGGSAADCQHIAAEFVSKLKTDRVPLSAIALTTDTSILTAVGNDYGFENLFKRQVLALGKESDVAIGISTSGKSINVIEGLKACNNIGIHTILMTGSSDVDQSLNFVDHVLRVRSFDTAYIQEVHIMFGHMLCARAEELIGV